MAPIRVRCDSCRGGCCLLPHSIFLSSLDVFNIRRATGKKTTELFATDLILCQIPQDPFPRARLKNPAGCPFLGESGCSILDYRPQTCRTYPVMVNPNGRVEVAEDCGFNGETPNEREHTLNGWRISNAVSLQDERRQNEFNDLFYEELIPRRRWFDSQRKLQEVAGFLYQFDLWIDRDPEGVGRDPATDYWWVDRALLRARAFAVSLGGP